MVKRMFPVSWRIYSTWELTHNKYQRMPDYKAVVTQGKKMRRQKHKTGFLVGISFGGWILCAYFFSLNFSLYILAQIFSAQYQFIWIPWKKKRGLRLVFFFLLRFWFMIVLAKFCFFSNFLFIFQYPIYHIDFPFLLEIFDFLLRRNQIFI